MYRQNKITKTSISYSVSKEGESIEKKLQRMIANKEPLAEKNVPIIHTLRADGIQPGYDIRTDKWEVAVEAMEKVHQRNGEARQAKRDELGYDTMSEEKRGEFHKKYPGHKFTLAAKNKENEGNPQP